MDYDNYNNMTLIGALDQGTSSSRFLIFSTDTWEIVTMHQTPMESTYPQEGWVEQDPKQILSTSLLCITRAVEKLVDMGRDPNDIKAIGITNQRETTISWDKITGEPLYPAIVWQDNRTSELLEGLMKANGVKDKDKECLKDKCGLPLSTYFSAGKIKWLITNVPQVSEAVQDERCLFGTVDSWIIWNFNRNNGVGKDDLHITDVTNASRTMLMNIATLEWDEDLCKFFGIPMHTLPEIRSSSEIYSRISLSPHLKDVPISGILGDQQAALVGQRCLLPGSVKNTYGTGCFLLYNTGTKLIYSKHGLLTTVAYKLGPGGVTHYALEGSVAIAGAAITWLVKSLNLMKDEHETESLAKSVPNTNGCYFVPAFSGLYAPYWDPNARGIICGLSHATNKGHIVRATLEAISFQTKEILDAMNKDTLNSHDIKSLHVDGGMATNKTLMQIQSDIAGIDIIRHEMLENTALGAAMAAANAKGIDLYDIEGAQAHYFEFTKFQPNISLPERQEKYTMWKKAVRRSLYWEGLQDIYQD